LAPGELLALVGPNGSGKTTLLRALALLVRPQAGTVCWDQAPVQADPEAWRARLAWLGHLDGLTGDLTVEENLLLASRLRGAPAPRPGGGAAWGALAVGPLPRGPLRPLSAGLRRRAALARVALSSAPLWLLDEPLNALDDGARQAFRTVLARHLADGGLVVAA